MEAAYLATSLNGSTGSQAADIINFHGYVVTPALPVAEAENEVVNLNNLQAVLSSTDLAKPLWDTEFSYGPAGLGDPDLNSAFIAKHLLIQAGQGIARAFYFDWDIGEQEALWSDTRSRIAWRQERRIVAAICARPELPTSKWRRGC